MVPHEKRRQRTVVNVEALQKDERMVIKAVQSGEFLNEIEQLKIQCYQDARYKVREVAKKSSAIHRPMTNMAS